MRCRSSFRSKAPFFKRVSLREDIAGDETGFPLSVPFVCRRTLDFTFDKQVTIVVGENGTGKSTLLEAIASPAGFNLAGGSADHRFGNERQAALAPFLRLSWLPKVSRGFFMRAEGFFNFANCIHQIARENQPPHVYAAYVEESLDAKSGGIRRRYSAGLTPDAPVKGTDRERASPPSRRRAGVRGRSRGSSRPIS
jgi:predicted ATPase